MLIKQLAINSFRSLMHHKLRSLLTTLGIIIGIVSIIAVSAIGQGAKTRIKEKIESLGTNFIIVLGGQSKRLAQRRGGGAQLTIKESDYQAVLNECDEIELISPALQVPVKSVHEGNNWQTIMGGVAANYPLIREWPLTKGSFFRRQDVLSNKRVAVIGQTVANELFENQEPVGKKIRVNKIPFEVIGVLSARGKRPDGFDEDDLILAPVSTVQKKVRGIRNKYSALIASAKSKETINKAANQIRSVLRQQHGLKGDEEDDFTLFTQDDISQASDAASAVLNILLIIIASISLIVGGIGIMNIMLVTVTERKSEIGIRMALGATTWNIRQQFVIEAIVICLIGGLLGISIGSGLSYLIGFISGWPITISAFAVIVSLVSSTLVGLFFGFYPAYQASLLEPVEALVEL